MKKQDVQQSLSGCDLVRAIYFFDEIDSTMNKAWEVARRAGPAAAHGTLVVARHQTAGRGRQGRVWDSAGRDSGLMFSLVLCEKTVRSVNPTARAELLSMTVAVAMCEAVRQFCGAGIKYPNDVVCEGRKVCGILIERALVRGQAVCVVGIGLNVNQELEQLPAGAATAATSIYLETGEQYALAQVLARVMDHLQGWLLQRSADEVVAQLEERCVTLGREVTIDVGLDAVVVGTARGISPSGGLRVETATGDRVVMSGEIVKLHYEA